MKYFKLKLFIVLFFVALSCNAENKNTIDHFEGVWGDYPGYGEISNFLIIQKIGDKYLVITAYTDDDKSQKSIGKRKNDNIIEVNLRGLKYTIKWDKDKNEEWLEMYINPNVEEYPYFERIENFLIDKF